MTQGSVSCQCLLPPCQKQAGGAGLPAASGPTLLGRASLRVEGGEAARTQPSLPHPALGLRGWNRVSSGANHPPPPKWLSGPVESHGRPKAHTSLCPAEMTLSPLAPSVKGGALAPSQFRENQSASLWIPGLFSFPRTKAGYYLLCMFLQASWPWVFCM